MYPVILASAHREPSMFLAQVSHDQVNGEAYVEASSAREAVVANVPIKHQINPYTIPTEPPFNKDGVLALCRGVVSLVIAL